MSELVGNTKGRFSGIESKKVLGSNSIVLCPLSKAHASNSPKYSFKSNKQWLRPTMTKNCFVLLCFLVTPMNQFLIILGRCTLYTMVCLQDEPTCMRIEPV